MKNNSTLRSPLHYGTLGDSVQFSGNSYPDELRFVDGTRLLLNHLITPQSGGYLVQGS